MPMMTTTTTKRTTPTSRNSGFFRMVCFSKFVVTTATIVTMTMMLVLSIVSLSSSSSPSSSPFFCHAFQQSPSSTSLTTRSTAGHIHQKRVVPVVAAVSKQLRLNATPETKTKTSSASSSTPTTTRTTTTTTTTTKTAWPTRRGTTVDSRTIIKTGAGRQHLTAVRLSHILFASEELAQASLHRLRTAELSFIELANQISLCDETRDEGGEIGWVSVVDTAFGGSTGSVIITPRSSSSSSNNNNDKAKAIDDSDSTSSESQQQSVAGSSSTTASHTDEHLDGILPQEARIQAIAITTKPGDIVMVESPRGFHLVQVVDVMANVRKMAFTKPRNNKNKIAAARRGVLSGILVENDDDANEEDNDVEAGVINQHDLTYKIETMGCQMNQADSERIEGQLQSLGIRRLDSESTEDAKVKPDVVVLNTCSIREHAESKVYSYLGPYAKRKREGEDVTIVVSGCVAQQEGEALLRRVPEVDLVMGPQYSNRIGDFFEEIANGNQVVATEASHIMEDSTKPRRQSSVCAWVNVIYGCNERCAFCIVPTTRGVEQSRPIEAIVAEVEELVAQGFKEVTLLGQNIDAYGRDMIPKRKFSDLLRIVGSVPGLERLRFVTSHPRYMSLSVVEEVLNTPSVCESFHIPFQSGSNAILSSMGRGHTREKFLHIVDRIKSKIPDASISADVIVGFPGETEEDFQDTLRLMEEVKFDSVNTAAYSPRPNTPAAVWDNQIEDDVKQDRLQRINVLVNKHAKERRARMLGRTVDVLVEERNVKIPTQVMGRTRHGYIAYLEGDIDELKGKIVDVHIDECHNWYLVGTRVS